MLSRSLEDVDPRLTTIRGKGFYTPGGFSNAAVSEEVLKAMGTHLVILGGNSAGLDGLVHAVGKITTLIETETE